MARESEHKKRPKKRGAFGRVIRSIFLMGFLALLAGVGAFVYGQSTLNAQGPLDKSKIVTIKRGMGTSAIARQLADQGVISDPAVFMAATYLLRSKRGSLKAGEFEFPPKASMNEVLKRLQAGKSLAYKVTIPEGWTTQNALKRIAANKVLVGEITIKPGEGSLKPDTYVFQRGTTRDALIKRMQKAQTRLLDELWAKRQKGLPIKTRKEALILASIVEKETGIKSERPHVASVFINRLNKKMRLQTDPTIIYGIVGGKGKMDRPISKADIARKTPYNTYQIDGLPPTPIANPGAEALAAVLNPIKTDDLFFVADGTGGHAFAKTNKGHEANVAKWRKIERARAKAAKAAKAVEAKAGGKEKASTSAASIVEKGKTDSKIVKPSAAKSDAKKPTAHKKGNKQKTNAHKENANTAKSTTGKSAPHSPVKKP